MDITEATEKDFDEIWPILYEVVSGLKHLRKHI